MRYGGFAARCAEWLCLSGSPALHCSRLRRRRRQSLLKPGGALSGEAQPSPHIGRQSRKTWQLRNMSYSAVISVSGIPVNAAMSATPCAFKMYLSIMRRF
jgi:hypothetical protein